MNITSKRQSYRLLEQGTFGNRLRIWNSLEELVKSRYTGTVSMRYKGNAGGGLAAYEVPAAKVAHVQKEWIHQGAQKELIVMNESAPDQELLIQGEVMGNLYPTILFYSHEKKKMRDALRQGKHALNLTAKLMLQHFLDPSSYEDALALFEMFPGHAVEFGTYARNLGNIPGRNTVFWEVRLY